MPHIIKAKLDEITADAERWKWLKEQAGYIEDGSFTNIKIHGDDATYTWHISIGTKCYYGRPHQPLGSFIDELMRMNK